MHGRYRASNALVAGDLCRRPAGLPQLFHIELLALAEADEQDALAPYPAERMDDARGIRLSLELARGDDLGDFLSDLLVDFPGDVVEKRRSALSKCRPP